MTPQERLDYLLETVETPTNTLVTIGMIRNSIGLTAEQYGQVLATFAMAKVPASNDFADVAKAAEMESSFIAMSGTGLSLSSATRQATIDQLAIAGQWPDEVRDAVKGLGVKRQKRWQTLEEYTEEPTLESVSREQIKAATLATVQALINPLQSKLNAIATWLNTAEALAMAPAEYQAYADSLLASEDGNP